MLRQIAVDQRGSAKSFATAGFGIDLDFEAFGEDYQGLLGEAAAFLFGEVSQTPVDVFRDIADLEGRHASILHAFCMLDASRRCEIMNCAQFGPKRAEQV